MPRDRPDRHRLDQPKAPRRAIPRPNVDSDVFGRISERIARFFGTARFLTIQTVIVVIWIAYNVAAAYYSHKGGPLPKPFDKYPFILLNLAFSTQAAYAAPFILLAQNRQADRERASIEEDRARNQRTTADTDYLTREVAALRLALGDVVTRDFLRSELQRLVDEIVERTGPDDDTDAPVG